MSIPVTILTGFLGSGKTTFLNDLLTHSPTIRYAIIENEFGEIGLDSALIKQDKDVVELSNGCICCSLNEKLIEVFQDLYTKSDSFDEVIIESTGLADPANVVMPLLTHPAVMSTFSIKSIICLIDAETIEDTLYEVPEVMNQLVYSDVLLINKADKVTNTYLNTISIKLSKLLPYAKVITGSKGDYPLESLVNHKRTTDFLKVNVEGVALDHKNGKINSISFEFNEAFDRELLTQRLTVFLLFQSKNIYRMKSEVYINGIPQSLIFQSVGTKLDVDDGRFWDGVQTPKSRFVFIGKDLKPRGFEHMLRQCFYKD